MAGLQPKGAWMTANGIRIRYYDWGGPGRPFVLLHPSGGFARIWDPVARGLYPDFRVIAPDQRGHGDTGKPRGTAYTGEDFAADLADFVDALGLDRFILGGHSLGGRASQIYGAQHPRRVSHIILVGGPHYVSLFEVPEERTANQLRVAEMRRTSTRFPSLEAAAANLRASRPTLGPEALDLFLKFNTRRHLDGSVEWKYNARAVAEGLSHIPDNLTSYARRITCPVLIARAQHTEALTVERVKRVLPIYQRATCVDIPNTHRYVQLENPGGLAQAIRRFVAANP